MEKYDIHMKDAKDHYNYAKIGDLNDILTRHNTISVDISKLLFDNKIKNVKISEIVEGNLYFVGQNENQLFIRRIFFHYDENKIKNGLTSDLLKFNFYINKTENKNNNYIKVEMFTFRFYDYV
jgi:hypothetical protein